MRAQQEANYGQALVIVNMQLVQKSTNKYGKKKEKKGKKILQTRLGMKSSHSCRLVYYYYQVLLIVDSSIVIEVVLILVY